MASGHVTKLARATSRSSSLRTTVPSGIVRDLGLELGDRIRWRVVVSDEGELVVELSKEP